MSDSSRPFGSYSPRDIVSICESSRGERKDRKGNSVWVPSRPIPYYSITERLKMAWDVIRYRADVIYW